MGAVGQIFNGNAGAGWQAASAPITTQTNLPGNIDATQGAGAGITDQQLKFMQALKAQKGLQNQTNVFNQQQKTADELSAEAAGVGPNPDQERFSQNVNRAAAMGAGTVASQKGINPALAARMAATTTAAAGQNAASDAAQMQAQQELTATKNLMAQQGAMAGTAATEVANEATEGQNLIQNNQSQQQIYQNALAAQNNAAVGNVASQNSANTEIQKGNQKAQMNSIGSLFGSAGSVLGGLDEGGEVEKMDNGGVAAIKPGTGPKILATAGQALAPGNGKNGGSQDPIYQGTQQFSQGLMNLAKKLYGGPSGTSPEALKQYQDAFNNAANAGQQTISPDYPSAAGADVPDLGAIEVADSGAADVATDAASDVGGDIAGDAASAFAAKGGRIRRMATGGVTGNEDEQAAGAESTILKLIPIALAALDKGGMPKSHAARYMKGMHPRYSHGEKIPVMVSPGEVYLKPSELPAVKKGANPLKVGQKIPGKAKVKGDSRKNDTVKKDLDDGGIVIPRSDTKNPRDASAFARAVMAKKAAKRN